MLAGDALIVAHHVGARGFGVAFNCPPRFDDDLVHVLYEADPACAAAMQAENQRKNVFVMPYCLGERDGDATFHVTANPYASSLLTPSADYAKYYCEVMLSGELDGVDVQGAYYDALYGNENEVVATQPVRMHSLDSLAAEGALPLGRLPDFLSLDTQGSEHAILRGARDVIARNVLAIATEIEFHAMYDRQPLFSALLDLAKEYGFHFAGFTHLQEISPYRAPLGRRAKGFVAFGDAIFLRSLEMLENTGDSPERCRLNAMKLAFISINFGYLEYALQALEYAAQYPPADGFSNLAREFGYVRFLNALQSAAVEMPRLFLASRRSDLVAQLRSRREHNFAAALVARLRQLFDPLRRVQERVVLLRLVLLLLVRSVKVLKRTVRRAAARSTLCAARLRGQAKAQSLAHPA